MVSIDFAVREASKLSWSSMILVYYFLYLLAIILLTFSTHVWFMSTTMFDWVTKPDFVLVITNMQVCLYCSDVIT